MQGTGELQLHEDKIMQTAVGKLEGMLSGRGSVRCWVEGRSDDRLDASLAGS